MFHVLQGTVVYLTKISDSNVQAIKKCRVLSVFCPKQSNGAHVSLLFTILKAVKDCFSSIVLVTFPPGEDKPTVTKPNLSFTKVLA